MVCLMCVSVLSIQFSILLFLLGNYDEQGSWPWTENILKSKFQIDITFEVCSLTIHQNFNIVFECTYCSYLRIIKSFCQKTRDI